MPQPRYYATAARVPTRSQPSFSAPPASRRQSNHPPIVYDPQKAEKTRFKSSKITPGNVGYDFGSHDDNRMFLGVSVRDHDATLRGSFVWIVLILMVIETAFFAWPIVATVLWKFEAAINWIWFLYGLRVLLLFWALITSGSLAVEKLWGVGNYSVKSFYRVYASFRPSGSLFGWSTLAFLTGCVLGIIAVAVSAALYVVYNSLTLYILTICIGVAAIVESFVAPFLLYTYGISRPVLRAKTIELERQKNKRTLYY